MIKHALSMVTTMLHVAHGTIPMHEPGGNHSKQRYKTKSGVYAAILEYASVCLILQFCCVLFLHVLHAYGYSRYLIIPNLSYVKRVGDWEE
jgi:hypothetical protein